MDITYKNPDKKYSIQRHGKNLCSVVKVLKDYDNEKDAIEDLSKLMVGELSEQALINNNKNKQLPFGIEKGGVFYAQATKNR